MTTMQRLGVPLLLAALVATGAALADEAPLLRITAAGKAVKLRDHALSAGCTGLPPTITFSQRPAHGTVDIKPLRFIFGKGYVNGVQKSCEGQPVDGMAIWYTPAAGFHGVDQVSWTADFDNGRHHRIDNHSAQITVQ